MPASPHEPNRVPPGPRGRFPADQVRSLRLRLGLTQDALARQLGVFSITVSRWERGISSPQHAASKRLWKMLKALG